MQNCRATLLLALTLICTDASACICRDAELDNLISSKDERGLAAYVMKNADVVVLAIARGFELFPKEGTAMSQRVTIEPIENFKGQTNALHTYLMSGWCQAHFRFGHPYLYAGSRDAEGRVWISSCLQGRVEPFYPKLNEHLKRLARQSPSGAAGSR